MSAPNIIRAYEAKIDDVNRTDMSLVARINTCEVDYYRSVLSPRGIRFDNYRNIGQPILWEHSKDIMRRFTDPIGNAMWIKHNGGPSPTEIIAKPRFLRDDFSRQRWEWYRDDVIRGWSVNIIPDEGSAGPPTREELRANPEWESAQIIYRNGHLIEFSGTVLPGNPNAVTSERASKVMDLVARNLLWLPDEAEPIYREALNRTAVVMPGLPDEARTMTDSVGGLAGGGATVKPDDGEPVERHVVEEDGKWYVYNRDKTKRLAGPYDSKEAADHRLGEIEAFKHEDEKRSTDDDDDPDVDDIARSAPDKPGPGEPASHADYGRCPHCGAPGVSRDGPNDRCGNGHVYPSKAAVAGDDDTGRSNPIDPAPMSRSVEPEPAPEPPAPTHPPEVLAELERLRTNPPPTLSDVVRLELLRFRGWAADKEAERQAYEDLYRKGVV